MATSLPTVTEARAKLREYIEQVTHSPKIEKELSRRIATFTAAAVREDRKKRGDGDSELVKLFDVFFNGRRAR